MNEEEMKKFVLDILKFEEVIRLKSAEFDPELCRFLVAMNANLEKLVSDEIYCKDVFLQIKKKISEGGSTLINLELLKFDSANQKITFRTTQMGQQKQSELDSFTVKTGQWKSLFGVWQNLQNVVALPIQAQAEKSDAIEFQSYKQFYDFFMEESKKGAYIQRYKGLGEMNPDQLKETTMTPANRTLLQVSIVDAMLADETFSILMGEEVEPRRQFISENALLAKELDV
jgi:DNA gyrase subunit B